MKGMGEINRFDLGTGRESKWESVGIGQEMEAAHSGEESETVEGEREESVGSDDGVVGEG